MQSYTGQTHIYMYTLPSSQSDYAVFLLCFMKFHIFLYYTPSLKCIKHTMYFYPLFHRTNNLMLGYMLEFSVKCLFRNLINLYVLCYDFTCIWLSLERN